MSRSISLLLAALGLSSACFSERLPPPTFRHTCGGDGQCGDGESCISGLCQVPCTLATAAEDCDISPQGGSYLGCINGVCSSPCQPDDDICPGAQSCTEIPGISEQLGAVICIERCSADSCPDGEICIEGFCAQSCDPTNPDSCNEGETCLLGVCVPDEVVDPSESGSGGGTE